MSYFGPYLEPGPQDLSTWSWLFEQDHLNITSSHGFRDGDTDDFLSHQELRDAAILISNSLAKDFQLQAGQTVAIVSRNTIWYPAAMLAASRLGAIVTCLPPEAKSKDLCYFFETSRTSLVFSDKEALEEVKRACQMQGIAENRVLLLGGYDDSPGSLKNLVKRGKSLSSQGIQPPWKGNKLSGSQCGFLSFSSGTTGKPKAVVISYSNVIAQLRQVRQLIPVDRLNTVLGILPFYHITGLIHLLHLPIALQQDIVIMAKFDMRRMMETISTYRCNELWLVPPLLIRLLNDPLAQGYDLSFVRQFNTGAAPLSEQVIVQLAARFPDVAIRQAWGMTETTSCLTLTPPGLTTWENATKVGKLVPGTEIRVVDPDSGKDVPKGQVGELWAKGPQVTLGYLDRPEETSDSYRPSGFLRTGDLGAIDADGFITIHDRIKEMIKVRGHGVAPAELEDLLHGHPQVRDVAVIGVPHDYSGEVPRAYIVLKDGAGSNSEISQELVDLVAKNKARHKRLAGGIEFVTEIPKSAAGKILRRVLKDAWRNSVKNAQRSAKL